MTTIGKPTPAETQGTQDAFARRGNTDRERNPFARDGNASPGFSGGDQLRQDGRPVAQQVSEAAFAAKMKQAVTDGGGGTSGADQMDDNAPRLLAMVEPPSISRLLAGETGGAVREAAGLSARANEMVETVSARVESAFRSAMQPAPGMPVNLRLQLDAGMHGLSGLVINSSATSLEVVLERVTGAMSDELLQAAQALARTLQERFPRRVVKVLDTVGSGEDGPSGIEGRTEGGPAASRETGKDSC